jgi:hypothetical protein
MFGIILVCSVLLSWVIDLTLWQGIVMNLFLVCVWMTGRRLGNEI